MDIVAVITGFAIIVIVSLVWLDHHIRSLIDEAFAERCTLCQFRAYREQDDAPTS